MLKYPLSLISFFFIQLNTCKECNVEDFLESQKIFQKQLNLSELANWNNPTILSHELNKIYINGYNGSNGLVETCNAYAKMGSYLNKKDISLSDCISTLFILKNVKEPSNALLYVSIINTMEYQCSAGFYNGIAQWKCLKRIFKYKYDDLMKCVTTMLNDYMVDSINICELVKTSIDCQTKIFRDICGNNQATYYGCESFHQFTDHLWPMCENTCNIFDY
ncbi:Hypothetical protein SRAE_X000123600 [Strongyloides ratti]|uniref:Uncharacterized protein n=1 Tax=Strongyloides ratti TaxID=34506 RepID=A0A090KPH7_STRRB|nr:Hypothetical protein SRAE_X000123600 [Strongyloides ratti]CEF59488.1 Hypothetical protein SRAE_X000123600 [Strongyloides ratti]